MAYITKDTTGLVQLWNNKPEYNHVMNCFQAWIKRGYYNEVAVDITANNYFNDMFKNEDIDLPCCYEILETKQKSIKL